MEFGSAPVMRSSLRQFLGLNFVRGFKQLQLDETAIQHQTDQVPDCAAPNQRNIKHLCSYRPVRGCNFCGVSCLFAPERGRSSPGLHACIFLFFKHPLAFSNRLNMTPTTINSCRFLGKVLPRDERFRSHGWYTQEDMLDIE